VRLNSKPQNILLRRHPQGDDRVLIGDVGISRPLAHTLDEARTAIGTPSYLAPEVFQSQPYSFFADVWSIGCILYELASLHQAFAARSFNDLSLKVCTGRMAPMRPGVSTALSDLIYDVLQVNPSRRPSVLSLLQSATVAPHVQVSHAGVCVDERLKRVIAPSC
jgi:serine/threonine protein kinase